MKKDFILKYIHSKFVLSRKDIKVFYPGTIREKIKVVTAYRSRENMVKCPENGKYIWAQQSISESGKILITGKWNYHLLYTVKLHQTSISLFKNIFILFSPIIIISYFLSLTTFYQNYSEIPVLYIPVLLKLRIYKKSIF